jgi:hypothetical protein
MATRDIRMSWRAHEVPSGWSGMIYTAKANAAGEIVERDAWRPADGGPPGGSPTTPLLVVLDGDRSEFVDGSLVSQDEADAAALRLRLTATDPDR